MTAIAPPSRCPSCGSERTGFWRNARPSDRRLAGRDAYPLERCDDCGTATVDAFEGSEDLASLYTRGTYAPTPAASNTLFEPVRSLFRRERMRLLRQLPYDARVLEVGAGDGRFLGALAERGYSVTGIEPYKNGTAAASSRIQRTTLEDAEVEAGSQDAVVLWHVLEHMDDPEQALRRAGSWLEPRGTLLLAVPNLASLQARVGGDRWFQQDVPRHRTHFTPVGIERLLVRSGFRIEDLHPVAAEQNLFGMWQTLLNRLTGEPDVLFRFVKHSLPHQSRIAAARDLAITAVAAPLLLLPAVLLELGAGLLGHGGSLIVRATPAGGR